MDTRKWSLSTCAECDFVLTPPQPKPKKLEPKQACLGIDKLIQEERDNHEWNVAFQKALVKRLEASERRITLDEYLDEDMDLGGPAKRGRKRKRRKEATAGTDAVTTGQVKVGTGDADAPLPEIQPVFKEKDCVCSRKIKRQEQKRKRFAKIMEKEQIKFEKLNMMAQRKYERERRKAYKKCEKTQLAAERGYFRGGKNGGGPTAEETFSVFIHMDPGEWSLSTSGKAEFTVSPKRLKPQKGCTCLDKLVDEERERHAKNIAFQKALIKRLEASEKRISYDDWNGEDDDDDDDEKGRKKSPSSYNIKLPKYTRQDKGSCMCFKKIKKEERKRKRFVKRLEKQQAKYEKQTLKAQRKYERRRVKAYRKCDKLQEAIDKQYLKGKDVTIAQGDDTYKVFLHMDPGDCGCNQRRNFSSLKACFFKCCVYLYLVGILCAYVAFYVITKF